MKKITISTKDYQRNLDIDSQEKALRVLRQLENDPSPSDMDQARKLLIQYNHPDKNSNPILSLDEINSIYKQNVNWILEHWNAHAQLELNDFKNGDVIVSVTIRTALDSDEKTVVVDYSKLLQRVPGSDHIPYTKYLKFKQLNICITMIFAIVLHKQNVIQILQGNDLQQQIQIPLSVALLGGKIIVHGVFDQRYALEIEGGIQPGDQTVIHSGGLPPNNNRTRPGDMYVSYNIHIPRIRDKNTRVIDL